jgi:hypothetical protein
MGKVWDENSKHFQAIATICLRRNHIPKLLQQDESWLTDHHLKAGLLWNTFRDRLGVSEFTRMLFDLGNQLQRVPFLFWMILFLKKKLMLLLRRSPLVTPQVQMGLMVVSSNFVAILFPQTFTDCAKTLLRVR